MSNYRDDTQETMVIGDSLWSGSRTAVNDVVRITAAVVFGMGAMAADALAISDEVVDRRVHVVSESIIATDEAPAAVHAAGVALERARVVDDAPGRLRVVIEDVLTAADEVSDRLGSVLLDQATVGEEVVDARRASQLVEDGLRVRDRAWQPARQLVEEPLRASVGAPGHLGAGVRLADALRASDEVLDARASPSAVLADGVRVSSESWGTLAARNDLADTVVVESTVVVRGGLGQVWTAPTSNWAMSRYAPARAEQLVVIGGAVHAVTAEGVFALDGDAEVMTAEVRTGLLDLTHGRGRLRMPEAAYLSYELRGAASMTVAQTQNGVVQQWTYALPPKPAEARTSGRFVFGRGLRGRHYGFTLRLEGTQGYVDDWHTLIAQNDRRI